MAAFSAPSARWSAHPSGRRHPLAPRARLCARQGCAVEASSTMTYDYGSRCVWIDPLDADESPAGYDLCDDHAGRLAVPSGWSRTDRRLPSPAALNCVAV